MQMRGKCEEGAVRRAPSAGRVTGVTGNEAGEAGWP